MNEIDPRQQTRSRWTLIILVAVFASPIILAFIVYKNKSLIPAGRVSHGEIISPAQPISEFSLKTPDDASFGLEDMRRKWSYVYVIENECDDACQLSLVKMRNARIAQGAEGRRVNYYLILTARSKAHLFSEEFMKAHPKLKILFANDSGAKPLLDIFKGSVEGRVENMKRVYMIDPIGNYMMFYEDGFDSLGIMEDLKLLLKASQIG